MTSSRPCWKTHVALLLVLSCLPSFSLAQKFDVSQWNLPFEPFRVVGAIHYVGTSELGAYLLTSPEGHVLIDGGLPESAPLIEQSIRALGFELTDIKVLLTTQAHFDHVGSLAALKEKSGGKVMVMAGDAQLVEAGGRGDYLFGDSMPFPAVKVDRVLKDGDTVTIGGITLKALLTPGHTKGCTTWTTDVVEGNRRLVVVFPGSTSVNPGTNLRGMPTYPAIADDFRHAYNVLKSLTPDVFLAAHAGFFDLPGKRAAQKAGAASNPFIDPAGYRKTIEERERAFIELAAKSM